MAECRIFARLTKVDEAKRAVIGRAVQEELDKADEIFDYAKSKPYFVAWSDAISAATDGKSLGNIRAMHGKVAAGKITKMDFNDTEKAIDIETKIVDDAEWNKVLEGVYTGFSIGGKYVGSPVAEKLVKGGETIEVKRYVANPSEISLVDNPCGPSAQFFSIHKADGTDAQIAFKKPDPEIAGTPEQVDEFATLLAESGKSMADVIDVLKREFSSDERKQAAKEGQALPDGSFPIKDKNDLANAIKAYGRAKDKEKAKAHIIKRAKALGATDMLPKDWTEKVEGGGALKKGLWNVQSFASTLEQLASVARSAQYDFDEEGDASPVPAQIRNAFADLVVAFKAMAVEEADECLAALKAHAGVGEDDEIEVEAGAKAVALRKQIDDADFPALVKLAGEHDVKLDGIKDVDGLREALRKGLKVDSARMQEVHDHAVAMGADCDAKKLAKAAANGDANAEITTLKDELAKATARIVALEKQPAPNVVALRLARAVSKEQDTGAASGDGVDPQTIQVEPSEYIFNADKSVDWAMSRLMKARRLGLKLKSGA